MPLSAISSKNTPTSNGPLVIMTPGSSSAKADGQYLRGFASWDQVDGALVKYFITDILPWLGQVDLSIAEGASEPTAFKIKSNVTGQTLEETGKIHVSSQGVISIPTVRPACGSLPGFAFL